MMRIKLAGQLQKDRAKDLIDKAPVGYIVTIDEEVRTSNQNAKLWPMLTDLHNQANLYGQMLSKDEWKDFATATLKKHRFVPDLDGTGFIAVGYSTSKMNKSKFSDLLECIYMIGARLGVEWSEPALEVINEYGIRELVSKAKPAIDD